jgi:hypothetical protein
MSRRLKQIAAFSKQALNYISVPEQRALMSGYTDGIIMMHTAIYY